MNNTIGSKSKGKTGQPLYTALSTEERLVVVANLIVDRILADQNSDSKLLKKLMRQDHVRANTN
jgi:hypothetical protein